RVRLSGFYIPPILFRSTRVARFYNHSEPCYFECSCWLVFAPIRLSSNAAAKTENKAVLRLVHRRRRISFPCRLRVPHVEHAQCFPQTADRRFGGLARAVFTAALRGNSHWRGDGAARWSPGRSLRRPL